MALATKLSNETEIQDLVTDVEAFYNEETDPDLQGKLVGITEMMLARRSTTVAVIVLTAPLKAVKGKGDDKETVELSAGQSVGVVIKHKLADLHTMLENQCWVEIRAKEKIELDNGNTMWRYGIRFRGRRSTYAASRTPNAEGSPSGSNKSKSGSSKSEDLEAF